MEHKFQAYLHENYEYVEGSSARGIDFPGLSVDMKVTSVKQPQSSCPFKSARQKIYGLGYSLLVFVYKKTDHSNDETATLNILHTVFVNAERTADYQTTTGLVKILENNGNKDDIQAFLLERMLPVDEIGVSTLSEEILNIKPEIGYLLSFDSREKASFVYELLTSSIATKFIESIVFKDNKRPITVGLLKRINIKKIAERLGYIDIYNHHFPSTNTNQKTLFGKAI